MKKEYIKPSSSNAYNSVKEIAPALAVGAALAGGYVVGRIVKAIEVRPEDINMTRALRRVAVSE